MDWTRITTGSAASWARGWGKGRVAVAGLLAAAIALVLLVDSETGDAGDSDLGDRRVRLERVVDGDTLRLDDGTRVRLIGINAPEIAHDGLDGECFGRRATEFVEGLIEPGEELRL